MDFDDKKDSLSNTGTVEDPNFQLLLQFKNVETLKQTYQLIRHILDV